MTSHFKKDVLRVTISNFILILAGVASGFLLPKILGVTDYGYYKIFNLYTTYVVFFDIGLADGIYLVYGGYKKNTLPKDKFITFFRFLSLIQLICLVVLSFISLVFLSSEYRFIVLALGIYLFANNIMNYF